jgi:hypothetical protein
LRKSKRPKREGSAVVQSSRLRLPTVVLLVLPLVIVNPAKGQENFCISAYGTSAVEHFLQDLQHSVAVDDRVHVAAMVRFPIGIRVHERALTLRNRDQLLKYYDVAFDPKVEAFIAKQKFSDLFCNWKGIMIGHGEVWINTSGKSSSLKIIAINNNPPWSPEDK